MKSRLWMIGLLLAAILALAWMAALGPIARTPGVYLTEGGLGYLVIDGNWFGSTITEPNWLPDQELYYGSVDTRIGRSYGGFSILTQLNTETLKNLGTNDPGPPGLLRLKLSAHGKGDFDLIAFRPIPSEFHPSGPPSPILKVFCPSYLHRVKDQGPPLFPDTARASRSQGRVSNCLPAAGRASR